MYVGVHARIALVQPDRQVIWSLLAFSDDASTSRCERIRSGDKQYSDKKSYNTLD